MGCAGCERLCLGIPLLLLLLLLISDGAPVVGGKGGGFLEALLPLELVGAVPEGLLGGRGRGRAEGSVNITDAQVLTVVFSRSVISSSATVNQVESQQDMFTFYPEVPGKMTWIASHIVQFVPFDGWPHDTKIQLKWGQGIQSYDGVPLQLRSSSPAFVHLITPALAVMNLKIVCERCKQWTNNGWAANIGLATDILPEVPPEGEIYLEFSHPVSPVDLEKHMKVFKAEQLDTEVDLGIQVRQCKGGSDHFSAECQNGQNCGSVETLCTIVKFGRAPDKNTRYELILKSGIKYSKHSGALKKDLSVTFGGLRKFRIPFVTTSGSEVFTVRSPKLTMWLPHGLSQGTSVEQLMSVISLTANSTGKKIEYDLRVEKSAVHLTAELKPAEAYKIEVGRSSSILDGFGQTLQGSSFLFATEPIEADFKPLEPRTQKVSIYEKNQDWGRKLMAMHKGNLSESPETFCKSDPTVSAWSATTESELTCLAVLQSRSAQKNLSDALGAHDQALGFIGGSEKTGNDGILEANVSEFIAKSGVIVTEHCRSNLYDHHLIVETDLQVAIVAWGNRKARAWITNMRNARPVKNATVRFYRPLSKQSQTALLGPNQFEKIFEGESDNRGIVEVDILTPTMHAVVEYKKKLMYIPNIAWTESKETGVQDVIHLDKKLVRPGETLHVIGFVTMEYKGVLIAAPNLMGPTLTISPPFNSSAGPIVRSLDVDSHGVFRAEVNIPKDARPAVYIVQFEATEVLGSFEKFTVRNNFPFTPVLEAEAPFWSTPDSKINIGITTRSSASTPVAQAVLNVSCTVIGDTDGPSQGKVMHSRLVTTRENGTANVEFDLKTFVPRPVAGSLMITTIMWESSTETFLTKKIATRLEYADIVASIERSVETDLPGQAFGVRVSAATLKGKRLARPATVFMKEIPKDLRSVDPVFNAPLQGRVIDQCNVIAGDMEYTCRLMLPTMGVFIIEICMEGIVDKDVEKTVCRRVPLGKTEKDWKSRPLNTHAKIGLVSITKEPHQRPGVSVFALDNPYKNSRALITWGNSLRFKQKVVTLEDKSLSSFNLTLGKECLGNCALSVAVAVPRQQPLSLEPKYRVPRSRLFDPLMPHIHEISLSVEVQQVQSMDAKINLRPEESKLPKPGEKLNLRVSVPTNWKQPVRVTVIGAKIEEARKAALTKTNRKGKNRDSKLTLDLAADFVTTSSSHLLLAPKTENVLKKTYLDRLMLDPWTPMFADEFGAGVKTHTVDLSTEEYQDLLRKPITVIPNKIKPEPATSSEHSSGIDPESVPADISSEASEEEILSYLSVGPLNPRPLIMTKTIKPGKQTFKFNLPDEPGTYLFKAYAAADRVVNNGSVLRFGSGELLLDVFGSFALHVKSPRFIRVGDVFDTAVEIVPKDLPQSSESPIPRLDVIASSPLLEVVGNKSSVLPRDNIFEAHFSLKAMGVGKASFEVVVEGVGGRKQIQKANLEILELQEASRYFEHYKIVGGEASKLLPRCIDNSTAPSSSKILDLYMGVGGLPAFLSFVKEFYNRMPNNDCPALVEVAFSSVLLYVIGEDYNVKSINKTLLDDSTRIAISAISENSELALEILERTTSGSLGLDLLAPCQGSSSGPAHKMGRIELSGKVATLYRVLNLANGLLIKSSSKSLNETAGRLSTLAGKWTKALESMVVMELRNEDSKITSAILAVASAGMGYSKSLDVFKDSNAYNVSRDFESLDVESQAYSLMAYLSSEDMGVSAMKSFNSSFQHLMKSVKKGPSVAYLSDTNKPTSPASYVGNALVLLACSTLESTMNSMKPHESILQALANFVANPALGRSGLEELSDFDRTVGMLALRMYDKSRGLATLNIETTVTVTNGSQILQGRFKSSTDLVSHSIQLHEGSVLSSFEVSTEGKGVIAVAALLTTIPELPYPNPLFQGIFVERVVHSLQSTEPVTVIPVGSMVRIVLHLTTTVDLPGTTIQVFMPGGLEVMHITGEGHKTFQTCAGRVLDLDDLACANQDIRSSMVTFTVERMRKGTHSIHFHALAAYLGEFFFPPVKAFVRTRPIEAGLSESGTIIICSQAAENCGFVEKNYTNTPEKCPLNCSRNGACNLKTGKCLCRWGFSGPGCSTFDAW